MSAPLVALPTFGPLSAPTLPLTQLSDDERATVARLQSEMQWRQAAMLTSEAYYLGEQHMTNLGIAIPKELQSIRTVIGWPATAAVDPLADRCTVLGFRLRGATDDDQDLWDLWDANNLTAESALLHTDALSLGSGWYTIGPGETPSDPPMIRVESPLNMAAEWDPRSLRPKNVLQQYWAAGGWHAVLYTPTENVYMDADSKNQWQTVRRDAHQLGRPLAVRVANRPRTRARWGASEITPAIRNITDAACRALLNLQVAGEIYGVPRRYILGATEADFQNTDGTAKTGWQTYMTTMLALERDENGEIPSVGQFPSYDPSVFTRVLDFYAAQMAAHTGATPQEMGLYTEGNPPSADAVEYADARRNRTARKKHALFGVGHAEALQLAVMLQNDGKLPADMRHIEVDWENPAVASFPAQANALSQLVAVGSLPPTSDVTLSRAGFTPVERQRLEADRQTYQGEQVLSEISQRLQQVRSGDTDTSVAAQP